MLAISNIHKKNVYLQKLNKAVEIFGKAVQEDSKLNYSAALQLYSKGLQEFLQIIFNEPNTKRKEALRERANVYLKRAEEIKDFCNQGSSVETAKPIANSSEQVQTGQTIQQDSDNKTALTAFTYIKLRMICFFYYKNVLIIKPNLCRSNVYIKSIVVKCLRNRSTRRIVRV